MSEQITTNRLDRLELTIDTRLLDLMWGVSELREIRPEVARSFVCSSFRRGLEDPVALENPEEIFNGYGTPPLNYASIQMPYWHGEGKITPNDNEIFDYMELVWEAPMPVKQLTPDTMIVYMRSAYGSAYVYSYSTHRIKG